MTATTDPTRLALAAHGDALTVLVRELREAVAQQYDAPPRTAATLGERVSGGLSDPTPARALHPQRLALRAAVMGAETTLAQSADALTAAASALTAALAPYRGDAPLDDLAEVASAADRLEELLAPMTPTPTETP